METSRAIVAKRFEEIQKFAGTPGGRSWRMDQDITPFLSERRSAHDLYILGDIVVKA